MAIVKVENPEIITVSFRQEKGDKDYGSCMWARFNFDTKHYHLSIESDCGNFSYGWYPTPDTEAFLDLCLRFDWLYFIDKMSSKSVIDEKETFRALLEHLEDYDDEAYATLSETDLRLLKDACGSYDDGYAVVHEIDDVLNGTEFFDKLTDYDIACCIVKDYPNNAKKIADIFRDHIRPFIKELIRKNEEKLEKIDFDYAAEDD